MLLRTMRYLRAQNVSRELQTKVKRYLEYNYDNKARTGMDPKLLANLSQTLKSEVLVALLMPIVRSFPLFQQSSRLFLVRICTGCLTHRHAPGDVVCDAGTIATSMFFVVTGKLVRLQRGMKENTSPMEYFEGYWIGELNLFNSDTRNYTVLSVTFSELLEITSHAFQQTLKDFPNMLQTYKELRGKIQSGDTSGVEFLCTTCGQPGHESGACVHQCVSDEPKLHWLFRGRWPFRRKNGTLSGSSSAEGTRRSSDPLNRLPSSIMEVNPDNALRRGQTRSRFMSWGRSASQPSKSREVSQEGIETVDNAPQDTHTKPLQCPAQAARP